MSKTRNVSFEELADSVVANTGKKKKPDASDSEGFDLPPQSFGKESERDFEQPQSRDVNAAAPGRINPANKK
jgi:hypothetical protein